VDDDLDLEDFWSEFEEPDSAADSPLALR
jgi:hypothetical protein